LPPLGLRLHHGPLPIVEAFRDTLDWVVEIGQLANDKIPVSLKIITVHAHDPGIAPLHGLLSDNLGTLEVDDLLAESRFVRDQRFAKLREMLKNGIRQLPASRQVGTLLESPLHPRELPPEFVLLILAHTIDGGILQQFGETWSK
jgi:hypothetical protein